MRILPSNAKILAVTAETKSSANLKVEQIILEMGGCLRVRSRGESRFLGSAAEGGDDAIRDDKHRKLFKKNQNVVHEHVQVSAPLRYLSTARKQNSGEPELDGYGWESLQFWMIFEAVALDGVIKMRYLQRTSWSPWGLLARGKASLESSFQLPMKYNASIAFTRNNDWMLLPRHCISC